MSYAKCTQFRITHDKSPLYCIPRDKREPRQRAGSPEVRLFKYGRGVYHIYNCENTETTFVSSQPPVYCIPRDKREPRKREESPEVRLFTSERGELVKQFYASS